LFEETSRLGGIVETVRREGFVIECGPDSWVTEKPWARDLAIELGCERSLFPPMTRDAKHISPKATPDCDAGRHAHDGADAIGQRCGFVPVQRAGEAGVSREPQFAEQLKVSALDDGNGSRDESVREFVVRHFGDEVANTIAAPMLAGVFGGDIATLSVRAVMPAFVALEREHGSLILGLQKRMRAGDAAAPFSQHFGADWED